MTKSHLFPICLTALSTVLLSATPIAAEVSAADVWTNQNSILVALGGPVIGEPAVNGVTTTYTGARSDFALPFGIGTVGMTQPTTLLTENSDGTVTITYPDGFNMAVNGEIYGEGSFAATIAGDTSTWSVLAHGEPGQVTYENTMDVITLSLASLTMDGKPVEDFSGELTMTQSDGTSTMTITEGDVITMEATSSAAVVTTVLNYDLTGVLSGESNSAATGVDVTYAISVPSSGLDVMNLAAGLRAGFQIAGDTATATNTSTSVTRDSLGVILSEQNSSQTGSAFRFAFDEAGLVLQGAVEDVTFDVREASLPFPISAEISRLSIDYAIPLLADAAAQKLVLGLSFEDMTVADALWNMIDGSNKLDRSPMTLALDLNADVVLTHDLLDIMAMSQIRQTGELPGQVPAITLNNLTLAGLGATVTASSNIALDWSVFEMMGSPMPSGTLNFRTEGLTAAMNALVEAGLMSPEDAFPVTMGLGVVGKPVGEDMYEGELEFTRDGQLFANGMQLQ